jgi:hypothetical protein
MEHFTLNFDTKLVREEMLDGEMHWVVPVAMMTECVANGSDGPMYYPADELEKWSPSWNYKPLVKNHPTNGSACTPAFLNTNRFGVVLNTRFDGKQRAEAWMNQRRTRKVFPAAVSAIANKRILEVSTGLFVDKIPETGNFGGKDYSARAINHRPDHLAVLESSEGACSVADGAGLMQYNEMSHEELHCDLQDALEKMYSDKIKETPSVGFPYIRAVFEDYLIYWWGGRMFQIGYAQSEDTVSLVGDAVEVEQKVSYEPVGNSSGETPEENDPMPKKELIDKIIKNSARTGFEEADRKTLEMLDEKKLEKLATNSEAPAEPKFKFTSQEELDAAVQEGIASTLQKDPKSLRDKAELAIKNAEKDPPPTTNGERAPLSPQEWMAACPPELKPVHNSMIKSYQTELNNLVSNITAHPNNKLRKEDLLKLDIDILRNMVAMNVTDSQHTQTDVQGVLGNFLGLGPLSNPLVANEISEALPLPTYNFADRQRAPSKG